MTDQISTHSRALAAAILALAVTAGCGSSDEPRDGGSSATPTPSRTPSTTGHAPTAVQAAPIAGTWSAMGLGQADFRGALAEQGRGEHSDAFVTRAGLGTSVDLTLEVGEEFWTLYMGTDGAPGTLTDRATYELRGKRVVVRPNSGGENVFRWTVDGDQLALALESTTEPPYDGLPGDVFQRALYTTSAFTRDDS